ncbi:hypothetical protein AGMMS49965_19050 [Bacteroidia bacterium]|nr:hypothetical protein AGMMS49965_19050 [Bacteroidia bacterium]
MIMNKIASILGVQVELIPMQKNELRGLNADLLLRFSFYALVFSRQTICVIQAKNNDTYTPLKYKRITAQIEKVVAMPVAVLLESLVYYERERLISQGVYFIISDKYAFLPSLIANVRAKEENRTSAKLTPAAQYILLYYLLADTKNKFTLRDMQKTMPYNYLALSRAVINLEDCKLCQTGKDDTGTKFIQFDSSKRDLWEKSQKYLSSPVKKILYSDSLPKENHAVSGINALSHYSHLNPEQYGSMAIRDKNFQPNAQYNNVEGIYRIEIWKYPTTMPYQSTGNIVDKLSLYLSMKGDPDARIEKELELLIEEMKW